MHETAWQVCETGETERVLIKMNYLNSIFYQFTPVSPVSHTCHAVSCTVSRGFNGFTRLPSKIDACSMVSDACYAKTDGGHGAYKL